MSATLSTQSQNSTMGGSSEAGGGEQASSSRSGSVNLSPPMMEMINKIDAKVKVRCHERPG